MGDYASNLGYRFFPNALCLEVRMFSPWQTHTGGGALLGMGSLAQLSSELTRRIA